jgi:hypothetical protein
VTACGVQVIPWPDQGTQRICSGAHAVASQESIIVVIGQIAFHVQLDDINQNVNILIRVADVAHSHISNRNGVACHVLHRHVKGRDADAFRYFESARYRNLRIVKELIKTNKVTNGKSSYFWIGRDLRQVPIAVIIGFVADYLFRRPAFNFGNFYDQQASGQNESGNMFHGVSLYRYRYSASLCNV